MTFRSKAGIRIKWLKANWPALVICGLLAILAVVAFVSVAIQSTGTGVYIFTDTTGQQGMSSYCWIGKGDLVCRKGSTGYVEVREYSKVVKSEDL